MRRANSGRRRWTRRWFMGVLAIGVIAVVGCQRRQYLPFLHRSYRGNYAIANDELRDLQFYVSRDILVKNPDPALAGSDAVIILRTGTPGVVTTATEDLLIISFGEDGADIPFLTDPGREEDRYWFATRLDDEPGYHKIKDLRKKAYHFEGAAYPVVYGADAYLLVDGNDLEKLIERRTHLGGAAPPHRRRQRY